MLPKSPKRGTALGANVDIYNAKQETRFPLSPFTIPETPESEKEYHCQTPPFSLGQSSPVSRSPRSRALTCKTKLLSNRSLQPQNKTSPKSGDTINVENVIGHFSSVKRPMHRSETYQKSKRPRTGQLVKSSEQESSLEGDDLNKFLQIIRETGDLHTQKTTIDFPKSMHKKPGKAEKILSEKNCSVLTLSDKILGNMTSQKRNSTTGSVTKLPQVSHKSSSGADEKENIPLGTEQSMDFNKVSSENQSDLVVSYTSWVCNNDAGENEKVSKQATKLGDDKKTITTAEENFSLLDDSWFNDEMEQSLVEPEHKKSKLE